MKRVTLSRGNNLFWLAFLLAIPAFLWNLGLVAFIEDEAIRALVALEMKISGDWITPTLHGEPYYKKPPFFNWIILVFYYLTGWINEWASRLPNVLALFGFAYTVYHFSRKHFSVLWSTVNALMLLTCGRILFWDSMLGLIDTTFSWLVFLQFMILWHWNERGRHKHFFFASYGLLVVTFLLKGLPALVFQAISLSVYFLWRKKGKQLFSRWHLVGILTFLLPTGIYYAAYGQKNAIEQLPFVLFRESTMRTPVEYGFGETLVHIIQFPFDMIYHFLPWTLLILFLFYGKSWSRLQGNRFIQFCGWIFLANIFVYWVSPGVFPRYLLMLFPLAFTVFLYLYVKALPDSPWPRIAFEWFAGIMMVVSITGILVFPYLEAFSVVSHSVIKSILLVIPLGFCFYYFVKKNRYRLYLLGVFLLIFRLMFDLFVLPTRNDADSDHRFRQSAYRIAQAYGEKSIHLYKDTDTDCTSTFYISSLSGQIIEHAYPPFSSDDLYLIDTIPHGVPAAFRVVDSLPIREHNRTLLLLEKR